MVQRRQDTREGSQFKGLRDKTSTDHCPVAGGSNGQGSPNAFGSRRSRARKPDADDNERRRCRSRKARDQTEDPQASRGGTVRLCGRHAAQRMNRGSNPPTVNAEQDVPRHLRSVRPGQTPVCYRGLVRFPALGASPTDSGRVSAATDTGARMPGSECLFAVHRPDTPTGLPNRTNSEHESFSPI